jgi:hypothetical protein
MTFNTFHKFQDWCINNEEIDVMEINFPGDKKYVTIHNLEDTNSLIVAEIVITAMDSDFYIGAFHANKYNGVIDIHE